MDKDNKDVGSEDLYAELRKTLETVDESEPLEKESKVASDQKPEEDKDIDTSKSKVDVEAGELSEEEISKLSPRAQKRIRDLAEKVKEFADKPKEETPKEEKIIPDENDEGNNSPKFKDVKEFLNAVEDQPSRKLLEKFYEVIKGETSSILAPIEQKNNEVKFETEFSKYDKIEGLSDYKNDLKKTFMRNPNQSLKSLIGEIAIDLQMNKVKPTESSPSLPNRNGEVNLDDLSKDDLYTKLDSLRG